jgi:hypothetical protein
MQGSGSAASSSCRAADYSAGWDSAQQQKRQRCQVTPSPRPPNPPRLLRAVNPLLLVGWVPVVTIAILVQFGCCDRFFSPSREGIRVHCGRVWCEGFA